MFIDQMLNGKQVNVIFIVLHKFAEWTFHTVSLLSQCCIIPTSCCLLQDYTCQWLIRCLNEKWALNSSRNAQTKKMTNWWVQSQGVRTCVLRELYTLYYEQQRLIPSLHPIKMSSGHKWCCIFNVLLSQLGQ